MLKKGIFMTTAGAVLWGLNGVVIQYFFTLYDIDGGVLTFIRTFFGGLVLFAIELIRDREGMLGIWKDRKSRIGLIVYAFLGLTLTQLAYTVSIQYTNAGVATVIQNLNILFTLVYVCVRMRRLPGRIESIGLVLALIGAFLIATEGDFTQLAISGIGLFWCLINALSVSVCNIASEDVVNKWGSPVVLAWSMLMGSIGVGAAYRPWAALSEIRPDAKFFLLCCFIVLVGTITAFGLFYTGLPMVGPVYAGMIGTMEPLTAALLAALWLNTHFSAATLIGFACILATVLLVTKMGEE